MQPIIGSGAANIPFHAVYEAMPVPVLVLAPDAPSFTIVAVNECYLQSTHTQRNLLIGQPFFTAFPPDESAAGEESGARMATSLSIVVSQAQAHTIPLMRYDLKPKDGETGEVRYWNLKHAPVFDNNGKVAYIVHTATDITASVAANGLDIYPSRQIAEIEGNSVAADISKDASAAYLQAVIDTSQTGIFLFSPVRDEQGEVVDFRFRIANRTLAAYVGQETGAVIGALGSTWFPAFKTNGLFDYYSETYLTGKVNRFEFHYNADGIDVWLDILSTRINDDVLVTFSDYTQLKQLQQKMEASLNDLKRSNNNLEEFAYVASHDLQEPLRKIKAFGDMLASRYKDQLGADGADMIGRMQLAAGRMKMLIEDLLTFSRISAQHHIAAPVNLDDVLHEVLTDLESSIKEKQAVVTLMPMQPLVGDALQLRQVFQNLLSNALKFGKKGEAVQINVSATIESGSDIEDFNIPAARRAESYQRIVVRDNGIGFEQQYAARIFQLFQRLHGRIDYPGTGIGLSIVQKVIEHHKGFIKAESAPGEGATFSLLLPVA